jgi:hypothetical protein
MTWVRFDDSVIDHPKVLIAGAAAELLWRRSISWSGKHLTDGLVRREALPVLFGNLSELGVAEDAAVARVVAAGLWEETETGWQIHDYLEYNPSRRAVRARRKLEREKKARQRDAGAEAVDRGRTGHFRSRRESLGESRGETPRESTATRSRPVPSPVVDLSDQRKGLSIEAERKPDLPLPPPPVLTSVNGSLQATTSPVKRKVPAARKTAAPPRPLDPADPAAIGLHIRKALDTWTACFEKEHKTKPVVTKGRDPSILVRLIRQRGIDEVCELIQGYLEVGTKWARDQKAWTIPAFSSQYNTLLAMKADGNL